jgi:hypothetical protein
MTNDIGRFSSSELRRLRTSPQKNRSQLNWFTAQPKSSYTSSRCQRTSATSTAAP